MDSAPPDARIVLTTLVVSYNTRDLTLEALRRLQVATASISAEVVLVDNASADGSAASVRQSCPWAKLIENTQNVGFARAVNQGLSEATGEFVLLLNPDCHVDAHSVLTMIRYLRSDSGVGVVGPMITHPEGRLKVLSAGYFPDARRLAAHYFGLTQLSLFGRSVRGLNLRLGRDDAGPRDVDWVSGACLLARRDLFEAVGGLSERWFMYAEDMDFCGRVLDRGLRVVHLPSAHAFHEVGASSESDAARATAGVSTIWIDNLEDFYVQRFDPSRLSLYGWRTAFAAGLATRALAYRLVALVRRDERKLWLRQAGNFAAFARRAIRRRGPGH